MKRGKIFFIILAILISCTIGVPSAFASECIDNNIGNMGIKDNINSHPASIIYHMKKISDGSTVDTEKIRHMTLPKNMKVFDQNKVDIFYKNDQNKNILIGRAEVRNGDLTVKFSEKVKMLTNVSPFFYLKAQNKEKVEKNSDISENLEKIKNEAIVNDSKEKDEANIPSDKSVLITNNRKVLPLKSGFRPGNDASILSASLNYNDKNPAVVDWLITINNKGIAIKDANFVDTLFNNQELIPGSVKVNYRNKDDDIIKTNTDNFNVVNQGNSQMFSINFGSLSSKEQGESDIPTSISIHYQTKMSYNAQNSEYINQVSIADGKNLIRKTKSTANWNKAFEVDENSDNTDINDDLKNNAPSQDSSKNTNITKKLPVTTNNVKPNYGSPRTNDYVKKDELPQTGMRNESNLTILGFTLLVGSLYISRKEYFKI